MDQTDKPAPESTVKNPFWRRKTFWLIAIVTLVLIGLAGLQTHNLLTKSSRKQRVLQQYEQRREELRRQQRQAATERARQHREAHEQFQNVSSQNFQKPSCEQLENRKAIIIQNSACDYRVRAVGTSKMAVVLFYHNSPETGQFTQKNPDNVKSMHYLNTYLSEQAERYGIDDVRVELTTYGPYELSQSTRLDKNSHGEVFEVYKETSKGNNVPEDKYDMVHYVELDTGDRKGVASPSSHRAFTKSKSVGVFVHETLHLFGAEDKYHNDDCTTIGTNDPFQRRDDPERGLDIMCNSYHIQYSVINDITAREIGWPN
ncbi:hypothetical protein BRC19_00845 [Candidatus Saccharibacteria bacterium QS_5_54_17]|nr:MAG: hypothetical protein BRC19_00845 [Candidatus Saccharibacteria bacterium QS_5_54_17]